MFRFYCFTIPITVYIVWNLFMELDCSRLDRFISNILLSVYCISLFTYYSELVSTPLWFIQLVGSLIVGFSMLLMVRRESLIENMEEI